MLIRFMVYFYLLTTGGDVCECYDDHTNGHWTGEACDACVTGWGLPFCTDCDPGM